MTGGPLRVALAGYGLAGRVFHAPLIAATPGLVLAAVVTGDPHRAAAATAGYPGTVVVASFDDVLADPGSYDVVVIATPNAAHVPLALAAVDAGIAVVVDKPLAVDAGSGARLVAAARDAGVALTVFHNRRWDADFLTLRRVVQEGRLGQVHRFESRFERWRPVPKVGSWRERAPVAQGGGLLLDLGSHLVDQALVLWGPVRRVYAEIDTRRADVASDDDTFVALEHSSGVRSQLWMSALAGRPGPRLRVLGDRGSYVSYSLDVQEAQLRDGVGPDDPSYGVVPADEWGALHAGDDCHPVPSARGDYAQFYRRLAAALTGDGPVPVDPADAVEVLRILDAARAAAAGHEVVTLVSGGSSPEG